jgi:hypothetical protein
MRISIIKIWLNFYVILMLKSNDLLYYMIILNIIKKLIKAESLPQASNFFNASLTSLGLSSITLNNNFSIFYSSLSFLSPYHDTISIPFYLCNLKLCEILSIMMILSIGRPILLKSLIVYPFALIICYRQRIWLT